jgi:DNA polymerase I
MPAPRPRLFLIDGYSNIFRAFYAIRNLSNSQGQPTNAVYGFVTMLRKLLREQAPELVGVALDVSRKTVRSERYEEYKANRAPMPEELRAQVPWIRQALAAYRIPVLEQPNYEADDVLGTLADKAAAEGYDVVLVSADKDLMQLVGPHVSLYHTGRDKLYDAAGVEEDFGVPPAKVADVLALMGDAVDNVPGVPGIGEKGARSLIAEYGTLEELLARAGEVSRKAYREGLEQHAEAARLSKELVTIHRDLPIPLEPAKLQHDPPDPEALRQLFTELEFFSLLDELGAAGGGELATAEEAASAAEWSERTAGLGAEVTLAAVGEDEPVGLAVALADGEEAAILFADFRRPGLRVAALASLTGWIADGGRELVGHDLKELLRLADREGSVVREGGAAARQAKLFDTMLASYLLRPAAHGHSLEELAFERLGHKALTAKDAGWDRGHQPPPGDARLFAFAGERVALVARTAGAMRQELEAAGGALSRIYREIEEPLMPVLMEMEEAGILLDVPYLEAMSAELATELTRLETEIYAIAGETFNINSSQQLGAILFEKLAYPVLKRTKKTKSYGTGAEILEELAARGYPLPERLLPYRELSKLKSTYVDALPALVGDDGRVHTRFNQAVAANGRLFSASPNLQNIPVRTELGQRIRRAFVAAPGHLLLVADYSQIELRVLAHIAGEETLTAAFQAGADVHRTTAATVFGVAPELVTADQRRAAKTINFGIIYGMSAYGLAQNLHIPPKQAEAFITAYLARYPGVKRYVDETLAAAERDGRVATLYGRVRHFPDIQSKNYNLRENARRMAINARIQGTAADLLKKAMVAVARRLADEHPAARLLLTVHDELVLEVPRGEEDAVGALVKTEMEGVAELTAPLVVDVGWGESWYAAKE